MDANAVLNQVIEIVNPIEEVSADSVVADVASFDSLAMLNIVEFYKAQGLKLKIKDLIKCKTVGDIAAWIVAQSQAK